MRAISKAIVLLALAVAIGAILGRRGLVDPQVVRDLIAHTRFARLLFIALQIAASLFFIPRTVLGIAAGLIFGLYLGTVLALLGAIAGAATGFLAVRWLGMGGSLDAAPHIGKLVQRAESGGWRAVALVRLTPLPHSVANTALALTNVAWGDYLIGSSIGMLPMTVAQVSIGASANLILIDHRAWLLASILLAAGIVASLFIGRLGRRSA